MSGFVLASSVLGVAGYGAVIMRTRKTNRNRKGGGSEEHAGLLSDDEE